jgi:Uma2 family endonuclease
MKAIPGPKLRSLPPGLPLLENGDHLTQAEFHRRYKEYPEDVKAELIGGIVYMASPLRVFHGSYHPDLGAPFWLYAAATPGTELLDNTTTILGEENEPQPDLSLRILSEWGGQAIVNPQGYLQGASELLAEIAHSSRSFDMYEKRTAYQQAGAKEYVVLCIEDKELHWFDFRAGRPIKPDRNGIFRSRVFPGLWIDGPALIHQDRQRLITAIQQGLASREHAAFVKRLEAAHRRLARE